MSLQQTKNSSVKLISLGCPKNLVDSEQIAGQLKNNGFQLEVDDQQVDIGIVNTCGFIDNAKKESIDTICQLIEQKNQGHIKYLVVTGCLSQRFKDELPDLLPEVDVFLGTGDFKRLPDIISQKISGEKKRQFTKNNPDEVDWIPTREITTPAHSRYIKISEGCSHTCSFCTIPLMRGTLKSRSVEAIISEMTQAVSNGTKEFNLIAQDLNEFGRDLTERSSLYHLFEEIGKIAGHFWVRPLYMYPLQFPDKLIRLMKDHPHIIPYVDIPLQHINDELLKSMNRGSSSKYIHRLLDQLRKHLTDIVLRTTFIVGYPGETKEKFKELLQFIKDIEFDRLGVFTYSQEENTPAAKIKDQLSQKEKAERRDTLMALQQKISLKKNSALIGKTFPVLLEGYSGKDRFMSEGHGRYFGQAPEIDGEVFVQWVGEAPPIGKFVDVKITGALEYDLLGEVAKTPTAFGI